MSLEERIYMSEFNIDITKTESISFAARESDTYSNLIVLDIKRELDSVMIGGTSEMYLTPTQMDLLGRFLIRTAESVREEQKNRK